MDYEQKPMYLQALGYVQGVRFDVRHLKKMEEEAETAFREHEAILNAYLIKKGWEGTQCPRY